MGFYEFLTIIFVMGAFFGLDWLAYRRVDKLLNRLMSEDYKQYRYYEDRWKKDLKQMSEAQKILNKEYVDHKHPVEDIDDEVIAQELHPENHIENYGDDWRSEEEEPITEATPKE